MPEHTIFLEDQLDKQDGIILQASSDFNQFGSGTNLTWWKPKCSENDPVLSVKKIDENTLILTSHVGHILEDRKDRIKGFLYNQLTLKPDDKKALKRIVHEAQRLHEALIDLSLYMNTPTMKDYQVVSGVMAGSMDFIGVNPFSRDDDNVFMSLDCESLRSNSLGKVIQFEGAPEATVLYRMDDDDALPFYAFAVEAFMYSIPNVVARAAPIVAKWRESQKVHLGHFEFEQGGNPHTILYDCDLLYPICTWYKAKSKDRTFLDFYSNFAMPRVRAKKNKRKWTEDDELAANEAGNPDNYIKDFNGLSEAYCQDIIDSGINKYRQDRISFIEDSLPEKLEKFPAFDLETKTDTNLCVSNDLKDMYLEDEIFEGDNKKVIKATVREDGNYDLVSLTGFFYNPRNSEVIYKDRLLNKSMKRTMELLLGTSFFYRIFYPYCVKRVISTVRKSG